MSAQNLKERFEVAVGETFTVDGHDFQFLRVVTDSRCPKDVTCVHAGWADIEIELGYKRKKQLLERKIPADITGVNRPFLLGVPSKNIKVVVGALKPYPLASDKFVDRQYVLEILVFDN